MVEQPWYANDARAAIMFSEMCAMFVHLKELGLKYGYYHEEFKSKPERQKKNLWMLGSRYR
jgi:hypothetical protein